MTVDSAAAQATAAEVAGVLRAAPAEVDAIQAAGTATAIATEEPVVTLALASGMVVLAGLAYLVHVIHGRLMQRARRRRESMAHLVVRHITTLQ